jgi:Type IV secretory system Conjugative DNA transfer
VHVIDPFGVISPETDSLNPMDAFAIPGVESSALSMDIAKQLSGGGKISKDPFWDIRGHDLSAGVIAAIAATREPQDRNLIEVRRMLKRDDSTYNLAVLLDTCGKKLPSFAYEEISNYLQTTDVTRSGIHATACSYFSVIASEAAQRTVKTSTIDLAAVRRGDLPGRAAHQARKPRTAVPAVDSGVDVGGAVAGRQPAETPHAVRHRRMRAARRLRPAADGLHAGTLLRHARLGLLPGPCADRADAAGRMVNGAQQHRGDPGVRCAKPVVGVGAVPRRGITARRLDYLLDPAFQGLYDPHPLLGSKPPGGGGGPAPSL